jgi:hypothetical protein
VVDKATPRFHSSRDYYVVPAECVYGTIEVKSSLSSGATGEMMKSLKSVTAFKGLQNWPSGSRLTPACAQSMGSRGTISLWQAWSSPMKALLSKR